MCLQLRVGPIGFLFAVAIGWSALRSTVLWFEREAPLARSRIIAWQTAPRLPARERQQAGIIEEMARTISPTVHMAAQRNMEPVTASMTTLAPARNDVAAALQPAGPDGALPFLQAPAAASSLPSRTSVSAWLLFRQRAGAAGLATAGQLGGSQAGARLRVPVASGLAGTLRVSGPVRQRLGKEAAVGLDWTPMPGTPVTLLVERRVGLDRGGRDAWAAGAYGGVYGVRLGGGFELDGYAQAGVVGLQRRDGFIDGALRAEREVARSGRLRIGIGAGAWGGAQPGASRLDVGPQIVAHLPVGSGGARLALEWRERVAGDARPGSGPALSLGADF